MEKNRVLPVESLEFELRYFEDGISLMMSQEFVGSYGPVLGAFVRGASGCSWQAWEKLFFFNEEEGRSKVRLHLLKLGSSSCNLCLWCDALVWKSISGESACSGSGFLVVPCFALPCNWKKIGWYNFLPSQENTLKLEPNFRDFGDSFRPKLFGVQRTVWLDIDILSSPSSGCV